MIACHLTYPAVQGVRRIPVDVAKHVIDRFEPTLVTVSALIISKNLAIFGDGAPGQRK